jgi:hypothetical protein
MSHPDATEALAIYRHFCKQTEHVVEYLGVARKLQNLLNVPVPNLKHVRILPSYFTFRLSVLCDFFVCLLSKLVSDLTDLFPGPGLTSGRASRIPRRSRFRAKQD